MGHRYVVSDDNKKIMYIDANKLYCHSLSQPLLYDEIKFDKNVKTEEILNNPDESDIVFFDVDLFYPDNVKEKTKSFPFVQKVKLYLKMILMKI